MKFPYTFVIEVKQEDIDYYRTKAKEGSDNIIMNNLFASALKRLQMFREYNLLVLDRSINLYKVVKGEIHYLFDGEISFGNGVREILFNHDSKNFSLIKPFTLWLTIDSSLHEKFYEPALYSAEGKLEL